MPVCHPKMFETLLGDCLVKLKDLADDSIHACITDPPYFIDGMGDEWDHEKIKKRMEKPGESCTVGGRPAVQHFDPEQSRRLYDFMLPICGELMRVMMPGSIAISFSQPRLIHRMTSAFEDVGFEIRDQYAWEHEGQAKAFSVKHHVMRNPKLPLDRKLAITGSMEGRRVPMLKPQFEPMTMAVKSREGTFWENWEKWGTGLADVTASLDGMFPGTLMKADVGADERDGNPHPTIKPVILIRHLVKLFSQPGQVILDPFMGSGSHGEAALSCGRRFIGIERDAMYFKYATDRLRRTR